jgi:hypothetical protein
MSATIHEKIAKLLALAGNNPNAHEAAAAAAKAQEMLFAHNLSMADVARSANRAEGYIERRMALVALSQADLQWQARIVFTVARTNFCSAVLIGGTGEMALLGERENLDVCDYLICYLWREIDRLAEDFYIQPRLALFGVEETKAGIRADFCRGASEIIHQRLLAQFEASRRANAKSMALVVSKENALNTFVRRQYPNVRGASLGRAGDARAYQAGQKAGRSVALNTGINAGAGRGQFALGAGR